MNSEDNPEKSSFIEEAVNYMQITLSPEDVLKLLNDDKVWEKFVTTANLSRDEAEAIREGLRKSDTVTQMKDRHQKAEKYRKRFLELYPLVKNRVEDHIAQLQELADKADKLHRDCTISKVTASSTGIVSGIMTIVGIVLAPVTAGLSTALTVTGMGLGAASAVTGITTSIVESTTMESIESSANNLASKSSDHEKEINDVLHDHNNAVASSENHSFRNLEDIGKFIRSIKLLRISPHLSDQATSHLKLETISVENDKVLRADAMTTAQSASKVLMIFGAASTGLSTLVDVVSLVLYSIDLHKGAKTQSAEKLRLWIQKLEDLLEKLKQIHKTLL